MSVTCTVVRAYVNIIARTLQGPTPVVVKLDIDLASMVAVAMV